MVVLGTALAGLLMLAEQSGGTVFSENATSPKYHSYDFESACGASVFRVRFRNGPKGWSRVEHVLIDGRPVPGVAETLDRFAARRTIDRIEIMHCGMDEQRPLFRGIIVLSKPETQPAGRQNELFFRLVRQGKRLAVRRRLGAARHVESLSPNQMKDRDGLAGKERRSRADSL